MVSAWANANHLSLGQVKVNKKSNEITAIPKLLEVLALKGRKEAFSNFNYLIININSQKCAA
jgi:hypothetical protein